MKIIKTDKAPQAIGPYSQAIISDRLVFTSGQIGIDPDSGYLDSESFDLEAMQVFKNLENLLIDSGSSLDRIIKLNIFILDMSDFEKLNAIMVRLFKGKKLPSRSTIEVSRLPKDARIEIDAIAEVRDDI